MQNNIQTSKLVFRRTLLQCLRHRSLARTLVFQIGQINRGYEELKAVYGARLRELLPSHSPAMSFLRIAPNLSGKASKSSYLTYPKSGTMRSGVVCRVETLVSRNKENGYLLLPTPVATDAGRWYSDHRALLNYLGSGHQQRLMYVAQAAGLTDTEILELYREVMSFTISDAKYTHLGTQLCLL